MPLERCHGCGCSVMMKGEGMQEEKPRTIHCMIAGLAALVMAIVACSSIGPIRPASDTEMDNIKSTQAASQSSGAGNFMPGDPTATPLGTDITDPNFVDGVIAYQAKNYERVVELMSPVIKANPDLAPPYRYRGMSYWYLGACEPALADFEKALALNPNYAHAWLGHGVSVECLGNQEEALADFRIALSIDPSLAAAHHNMGVYYFQVGAYQESLDEYSLELAIDPTRSGAWAGRASALGMLGRLNECIEDANKALEINPQEWSAYMQRGQCESLGEEYSLAAEDYRIYLENESDVQAVIWYNYGIALKKTGRSMEALKAYNQALDMDPTYAPAYINRGGVNTDIGRLDDALADYDRALGFGDIPFAYMGRGNVYYLKGEYEKSAADFENAISLMPHTPEAGNSYCSLGLVYLKLERYEDSLDAIRTGKELSPDCKGQKVLLAEGRDYYGLGDLEKGIELMTLANDAGFSFIGYYYRGIMYQELGRNQEAVSDFNMFLKHVTEVVTYSKEIEDAKARLEELAH